MDAALAALFGVAPQLGGGSLLLVLFVVALRWHGQDRADYRAELARINDAHDAELEELRADIRELRRQLDEVNAALDAERERRRLAEDSAMQQADRRRDQQGGTP